MYATSCHNWGLCTCLHNILLRCNGYLYVTCVSMGCNILKQWCMTSLIYIARMLGWKAIISEDGFLWWSNTQASWCTLVLTPFELSCINGISKKFLLMYIMEGYAKLHLLRLLQADEAFINLPIPSQLINSGECQNTTHRVSTKTLPICSCHQSEWTILMLQLHVVINWGVYSKMVHKLGYYFDVSHSRY